MTKKEFMEKYGHILPGGGEGYIDIRTNLLKDLDKLIQHMQLSDNQIISGLGENGYDPDVFPFRLQGAKWYRDNFKEINK